MRCNLVDYYWNYCQYSLFMSFSEKWAARCLSEWCKITVLPHLRSVCVLLVHVVEMMWSRHAVRCYDNMDYDVNNTPALLSVELWRHFVAHHDCNSTSLIVPVAFTHGRLCWSIRTHSIQKPFFFFKEACVRNYWLGLTWGRGCLDGWLWTMSTRSSCCLHLSSEFWWWHDFSWLPYWLSCYVTSSFPILLQVVKQKPQDECIWKVKGQNPKPLKTAPGIIGCTCGSV